MNKLNERYKVLRKGTTIIDDESLSRALAYCLHGPDADLDIRIGDYVITLADGSGWHGANDNGAGENGP